MKLASTLSVPPEISTSTTLIVGKRGSGKSNTAVRMAEGLARAHIPFAVLDPVDVWWGLKAGGTGHREHGLEVYVFGGLHGDLPLEPTAGSLMADVLVDHRISAVFVLRVFSNREKAQFVSAFAERLFQRNREVLHLFCEEAHETMPQQPYKGEEEMLGRMLKLQKLGRTAGIGLTSITQRVASLNKNTTTQAEILITHRLTGPQDRDAVVEWIRYHHVEDQKREVLETLPTLKTGEAWVWAPDFPEAHPVGLKRVQVLKTETYDSRETPKPGQRHHEPTQLKRVDLDRIQEKMTATIERAKADDPKALKTKVTQLEALLKANQAKMADLPPIIKEIGVPVLQGKELAKLDTFCTKLLREAERHNAATSLFWDNLTHLANNLLKSITVCSSAPAKIQYGPPVTTPKPLTVKQTKQIRTKLSQPYGDRLSGPEQRVLDACAWLQRVMPEGANQAAVAFMAGYTSGGGAFNNPRGALRVKGLIEYLADGKMRLTDEGRKYAQHPSDMPTPAVLQEEVLKILPGPHQKILRALLVRYPHEISQEECAQHAGYNLGGAFNNPKGRLRSMGLITYPRPGFVQASPMLFLEEP